MIDTICVAVIEYYYINFSMSEFMTYFGWSELTFYDNRIVDYIFILR